jgi:serine/threonine protein kinase
MGSDDYRQGHVLNGAFCIEKLIGKGSSGSVYRALCLERGHPVALKVLLSAEGKVPDDEMLARFQREAQITSRLGHPHIIRVLDFVQSPDHPPYIVMELLEGENLARRLKRVTRLSLSETAKILHPLTSALQAAHDQGIVHRDLKPSNVFLCAQKHGGDRVKLLDFGLSKLLAAEHNLTRDDEILGSPLYMSPEQVMGHTARSTPRTDIFTTGVLLYLMLTGRVPFSGQTVPVVFSKIARHPPPPMNDAKVTLPRGVERVILKALSKRPEDRQRSASELWQEFYTASPGL